MNKSSPEQIAEDKEQLKMWQEELDRFQALVPLQLSSERLRNTEIPALDRQMKEQELSIPPLSQKAEEVGCPFDRRQA